MTKYTGTVKITREYTFQNVEVEVDGDEARAETAMEEAVKARIALSKEGIEAIADDHSEEVEVEDLDTEEEEEEAEE